jgi:hypothetical protein
MNRSQRFGLCVAVLCLLAVFAHTRQTLAGSAEDWRPIDPADLALKDNPASPGANAMILYRESAVNEKYAERDGAFTTEYLRKKIFTQEGTDAANVEIPFFKEYSDVKDIRARTIRPDGTIVNFEGKPFEKTIAKRSGLQYLAKTFSLPDVKPGCIIEYKYRLQFKPLHLPDHEWVVSSDIYTREGRFSILPYDSYWQNFPLRFRQYGMKETVTPQKQQDGYWAVTVKDIPGVWDEPDMPPDRALEARIEFFHDDEGTPPNETLDQYWARTEKHWNDEFDHFIGKKSAMEPEVAKTVASTDTPEQKLRKLYDRAQQIRNLSNEDSKSEKEAKQENLKKNNNADDVLKHGYGDAREINLLYVAMARAAGFDSNSVLLAPRNYGVFYSQMRDTSALNADIVWVKAGDKEYWLDPGARFYPFGILPWYETNTAGVRVSSKPSDFVTSPDPKIDDAVITRTADISIDADGAATGKISVDFGGQFAALRREEGRKDDETAHKKTTEDDIKKWLPADANFELTKLDNWDKTDQPLHVEGTVKVANFGSSVGHRLLVPASIFVPSQTQTFATAVRHNAIYFHFPYKEDDTLKYTAPATFKVETVPEKKATNPASIVAYEMSATHDGTSAEVKRTLKINALVIQSQYYAALRAFFNTVKSNDESQLVLQTSETAKN